ncbi:hypothetical protein [Flagellimonas hadalis]|uniref:Uncharacterized protein n=1 Tax=Flagellimonas hadalis TaxID=2597517 RepID=A0A5N5IXE9_9FLAO|nr:hypothetical protein [Allomuricauda hadalis]KAB5491377.1 hypothetical protein FOT42_000040 [Allomuricauda hadalis]
MNYLLLWLLILGFSCNNDDDTLGNPMDALPPATQTGEQTFGCLIDGRPFFPDKFGGGRPTAFYQISEGGIHLLSGHRAEMMSLQNPSQ